MTPDYAVRLKSNGAYWQAAWVDADGKTIQKSLGPKAKLSERQAESRCRQLSVDLKMGTVRGGGKAPRLSEWIEQYLRLRTDIAPKTRLEVQKAGEYLTAYFTNDPPIDRISRSDAAEWRAALARGELREAGRHLKPDDQLRPATRTQAYRRRQKAELATDIRLLQDATVAKHVRSVKRMFAEAAGGKGLGIISDNPFDRLSGKAPRAPRAWRTLTVRELGKVVDACPDDAWRAAFALSRLAGLRRGECLRLQWRDVDWTGNRLNVNARVTKVTTKLRPRVLPIEPGRCPTGLTAMLRSWSAAATDGATHVCPGIPATSVDSTARSILRTSGVGRYAKPFHALRKCRAVEVAAEYPQHVLCEWMGHSAEVSREFYLRVEEELFAPPAAVESARLAQKMAQTEFECDGSGI